MLDTFLRVVVVVLAVLDLSVEGKSDLTAQRMERNLCYGRVCGRTLR